MRLGLRRPKIIPGLRKNLKSQTSCWWDSNPRPRPYQGRTLPTELQQHGFCQREFHHRGDMSPAVPLTGSGKNRRLPGKFQWIGLWREVRGKKENIFRSKCSSSMLLPRHLPLPSCHLEQRAKGIEPSPPAWKAGALPLSYARGRVEGLELRVEGRKSRIPTLDSQPTTINLPMVGTGFEPVKAYAARFTVWPLWPLGNPTEKVESRGPRVESRQERYQLLALSGS